MKIDIEVPSLPELFQNGVPVHLAPKGIQWRTNQLGKFAKEKGVYLIYHEGVVKYIGKTDGPSMSYGMRLRREFQEGASQGRHIYPKLAQLSSSHPIMVYFCTLNDVRKYVTSTEGEIGDNNRNAIFEQVLIQIYSPEFQ